jgi:uncharacterized repeat protein (TIGR02543 family)
VAKGIVLKKIGNKAFSALILSLGLIAGLAPTANAIVEGEYEIVWNDNGAITPSGGGSEIAQIDDQGWLTAYQVPSQIPTKIGYNFDGWVTSLSNEKCNVGFDETPNIVDCDLTLSGSTLTFFAQWTPLLTALTASSGTSVSLSPTFASSTTSYTASVGNSTTSINVTPTESDDVTVVKYLGSTGDTEFTGDLSVGENIIRIVVTGTDQRPQTYTITVTRAAAASSDSSLSALALSTGTLSTTFASGTTSYTASVGNSTSSITVTPTVNQANATVEAKVGAGTYSSVTSASASSALALAVGDNTVSIRVTAQNGSTSTYTVTVTRAAAASSDSSLSALALSTGTLSTTFASGTTSYTASVGNSTSSITVTPTVNQANATVEAKVGAGTYSSVTSASASSALALAVGDNTVSIRVTAQNGSTSTYTVTVTRAAQVNNTNTVTWNGQGATTASSGGSSTYTNGSSISTIPTTAPQKTGHTFVGWFTGTSSGSQITNGSFTPASPYVNQTFYAHWTVNRTSSVGTWAWTNQSSAGSRKWHALATSADGSKLYAGVDDGGSLYRSTDFGVTWSVIADTSGKDWFSIASNIDGTKVAAVDRGGDIWTSTNSGSTWTQRSVGAVRNWESIASSSDGSKLVAVASNGDSNGFIYTSSNSGVTWSSNLAPAGTNKFTGVASSNDGTYLAATTWANGIYTSSNSGQTWTARTLPVPNSGSTTYLQAVASSGDGSRLVTGSRTLAGGSNGGVIFTSADYGVTWKAFTQTTLDYINFTSNGDGSRLAATVYDQTGVSTSADFGATWSFQSVGLSGEIPIASNIDGSLLFVGAYGGNLWTGKIPNARVAAVLPASTTANLEAAANAPATAITFTASSAAAAMTVTPITNPTTEAATPFSVAQASIFDISVVNVTGQVTICVDGGPNVRLWHFTNGAWVDITTNQTTTQTCGLSSSFSPFATGPAAQDAAAAQAAAALAAAAAAAQQSAVLAAQAAAQAAAMEAAMEAARVAAEIKAAEVAKAKSDLKNTLQSDGKPSLDTFKAAGIEGITQKNLEKVTEKILTLPVEQRSNPASIEKMITVVTFFDPQTPPVLADFVAKGIGSVTDRILNKVAKELLTVEENQQGDLVVIKQIVQRVATVDKLSTPGTSKSVQASDLVAIGALSKSNPKRITITAALKKLDPSRIDTYQEVLAEIAKQEAIIKARAEKSAAIKAKLAARR